MVAAGKGVGLNLRLVRTCLNLTLMCLCSCRLIHKHTGVLLAKTDMNILKEIQVILHLYHNKYYKTVNSAALALFQENNHLHIIKS